uniref:Uncharacterized protein n=1 Tax=Caenorhabditis tropicalis TaxID=1561998 RepID=A0A1I7SZW9_9PELO
MIHALPIGGQQDQLLAVYQPMEMDGSGIDGSGTELWTQLSGSHQTIVHQEQLQLSIPIFYICLTRFYIFLSNFFFFF